MVDHRRQRLGHVALARELLPDPVADLRRLRRPAADVVERDRPHQPAVVAADQEQRQRPPLVARPPRPVDPAAERLAREVVRGPARLPVAQERLAVAAQLRPRRMVAPSPAAAAASAASRSRAARRGGTSASQAARRPASDARSGASATGPSSATAGSARRARPSAKARSRSECHCVDLGDRLVDVRHPVPDREHARQPLGPRRRALEPHQQPGLQLRPRPLQLGRRSARRRRGGARRWSARRARGSGARRCRHRA